MEMNKSATRNAWVLCLATAMTISCSSEAEILSAEEIYASIEIGEDVEQTAPHSLSLYPGSTVTLRLMDGLAMHISTEASLSQLAAFHSSDLEQNGYRLEAVTEEKNEVNIQSVNLEDPTTKLIIAIKPSDQGNGRFVLTFLKLVAD